MKKLIALAVLLFASTGANAYDYGTTGMVAGLAGAGVALGLVFGAVPAIGTIAIGAAVSGITFDPTQTGASVITAQLNSKAPMTTPAGYTAPVYPNSQPVPPSTVTSSATYGLSGQPYSGYATKAALCNARSAGGYAVSNDCYSAGGGWTGTIISSVSCPSGYTVSGSNCVLSSASAVQKPADGKCVIVRTGNTFAVDPQDSVDCAAKPATIEVQPSYVKETLPDGTVKQVTLNSDGTATATQSKPNTSTNNTETQTSNFGAPAADGTVKLTGRAEGATSGIGTGAGSGVTAFDKSGLATESTQTGIKSDTAAIKDALTGTADTTLAGAQTGFDSAASARASALNGLNQNPTDTGGFTWGFDIASLVPAQCGCAPLTMTIQGHTGTFDWCPYLDQARDILGYMVYVGTLFMLVTTLVGTKKD